MTVKNLYPDKHPFIKDLHKTSYTFNGQIMYASRPAYDIYSYPKYNASNKIVGLLHYDFRKCELEVISFTLENLVSRMKLQDFINLCKCLCVPDRDIKQIMVDILLKTGKN